MDQLKTKNIELLSTDKNVQNNPIFFANWFVLLKYKKNFNFFCIWSLLRKIMIIPYLINESEQNCCALTCSFSSLKKIQPLEHAKNITKKVNST